MQQGGGCRGDLAVIRKQKQVIMKRKNGWGKKMAGWQGKVLIVEVGSIGVRQGLWHANIGYGKEMQAKE